MLCLILKKPLCSFCAWQLMSLLVGSLETRSRDGIHSRSLLWARQAPSGLGCAALALGVPVASVSIADVELLPFAEWTLMTKMGRDPANFQGEHLQGGGQITACFQWRKTAVC